MSVAAALAPPPLGPGVAAHAAGRHLVLAAPSRDGLPAFGHAAPAPSGLAPPRLRAPHVQSVSSVMQVLSKHRKNTYINSNSSNNM